MTEAEIFENAGAISEQIKRIYHVGMKLSGATAFKPLNFVDNLSWFKNMTFVKFLSDMGRQMKVNSMLSRNWYKFISLRILY